MIKIDWSLICKKERKEGSLGLESKVCYEKKIFLSFEYLNGFWNFWLLW